MSLLRRTINILTDRRDIKEPIIYKDISESNNMCEALNRLSESNEPSVNMKKVKEHIKLFSIGHAGEKSVLFELQHSMLPMIVLHDLNLIFEEYSAQLDFVVITHKFILIIEVKKLLGDIEVTDSGDFIRVLRNNNRIVHREGMYNPISQVERHVAILDKCLRKEKVIKRCPIYHVVTFANPKTILNISRKAPKHIRSSIIRHDQIKSFIESKLKDESPVYMLDRFLYQIADSLMDLHQDKQINLKSYFYDAESIPKQKTRTLSTDELREKLTSYRLKKSKELNIKPYYIFTNRTLDALIIEQPKTMEQLLKIEGIGPVKAETYGLDILNIINNEMEEI